jgi:hypothetical protein
MWLVGRQHNRESHEHALFIRDYRSLAVRLPELARRKGSSLSAFGRLLSEGLLATGDTLTEDSSVWLAAVVY